ncbi:MAG: family 2 glycosyl transferase, partial [Actinomycetes bacterium]
LSPVLAGLAWIGQGAGDPLERRSAEALPAYVAAEAATPRHPRTLVLRQDDGGRVRYAVLRDAGPTLGASETAPRAETQGRLDRLVADIMSASGGGDEARQLAAFGARYVLVTGSVQPSIIERLDAVPGIDRVSTERSSALWRLRGSQARLVLRSEDGQDETPLPSGRIGAETPLPPGDPGRRLVLAEQADEGWTATVDGQVAQPVTIDGWAQGFEIPASGGRLVLSHESDSALQWTILQALLAFAALVMALPGARTTEEPEAAPPPTLADPQPGPRSRSGRGSSGSGGRRGRRRRGRRSRQPVPARSRRRS